MSNPIRTHKDIRDVQISSVTPGFAGWTVQLRYKDGKRATFTIDPSKNPDFDMLDCAFKAIKLQMAGTNGQAS